MKKFTLIFVAMFLMSSPVFAESISEICTTEAKDAGYTEADELNAYVNECIEQMNTSAQTDEEQSEAGRSEVEKGVAITD